ncbi:MAG: hypothetical protein MI808_23455 [Pseudomonadales bacterium]|nr:hypothetical protein [Pseudomonadales bacterium]
MFIDQFWIGALIAVVLAGAMLFLLLQVQKMKHNQKQLADEKRALESRIKSLESKIDFLSTGSMGIGQRLMNTEKKLHQAMEKQNEMSQGNIGNLFQRQADRVLKGKKIPDDDVASPSRSEAKLMALVSNNDPNKN